MSRQDRRIARDREADAEYKRIFEEARFRVARAFRVPMSVVDGRPWVPREDEMPVDEARRLDK